GLGREPRLALVHGPGELAEQRARRPVVGGEADRDREVVKRRGPGEIHEALRDDGTAHDNRANVSHDPTVRSFADRAVSSRSGAPAACRTLSDGGWLQASRAARYGTVQLTRGEQFTASSSGRWHAPCSSKARGEERCPISRSRPKRRPTSSKK